MQQVVNAIEGRMRALLVERRRAARRRAVCEVRIPLGVSLPHELLDPEEEEFPHPIMGHTRDLSATGLSLLLPATRLGSRDVSHKGARLRLVLCLPTGVIVVRAETVHCEPFDCEEGEPQFLLGARITKMFDTDRRAYDTFLRSLSPRGAVEPSG
ncbi:MAG: PilZ domain-containing protein [Pyrinomonadaceae bacterium]